MGDKDIGDKEAFLIMTSQFEVEKIIDSRKNESGEMEYKALCISYNWLSETDLAEYSHLIHKFRNKKKVGRKRKVKEPVNSEIAGHQPNKVLNEQNKPSVGDEETNVVPLEKPLPKRSKRLKENDERMTSFTCQYCDKSFRTEDIYTAHMLDHNQELNPREKDKLIQDIIEVIFNDKQKEYKCRVCDALIREKRDALSHQKIHAGTNPWYCQQCDKHFLRKYQYTRHILIHTGTKNFICEHCGKTFNGLDYLKRHQTTFCAADKGRHKCCICNEVFGERRLLKAHIAIHKGTNPFYCNVCEKFFLKLNLFENHMLLHDERNTPFKCSICDSLHESEEDLSQHIETHEEDTFRCLSCKDTYTLQEDLEMHYQMSESCLEIICTECNIEFPSVEELTVHLHTEATKSKTDGPCVIYMCPFCQRGFHAESAFQQHQSLHVFEKSLKCAHCETVLPTSQGLEIHMRTAHGTSKSFPCLECGEVLESKVDLTEHMNSSHSNDTTYSCMLCDKRFYVQSDLNRHLLTKQHLKKAEGFSTKQKKLKCSICGKIFQNTHELKRHEFLHQRVQMKSTREMVINENANDPSSYMTYIDTGLYQLEGGEQVIVTDQQGGVMNAKVNVDSTGNVGLFYIDSAEAQQKSDAAENANEKEGKVKQTNQLTTVENVSTEVSIEPATDSNAPPAMIQIPHVSGESVIVDSSETAIVSNETAPTVQTCNEETFLALSEMIQQGKIDLSSLQVIQAAPDSTDS